MIKKPLSVPIPIYQEQALLRRIPESHVKIPLIKADLAKRLSGYKGEKKIGYYLSFLNNKQYDIFYGLRLIHEYAFQMDILLVSKKFLLIIEVKNISGTLLFDRFSDQLIRIIEDKEDRFSNPIIQAKRQKQQLQSWIRDHKLSAIPIEYLIVNANPSTILKSNHYNQELLDRVIHDEQLPEKIEKFERKFREDVYELKNLQKLNRLLLRSHEELILDIMKKFQIDRNIILPGVRCTKCKKIKMERLFGKWYCPICQVDSKDAHVEAICDYLLLFTTITNKECRQFLRLSSRVTSTNLLHSLQLPGTGSTKGTHYSLPDITKINSYSFPYHIE